MFQTLINTSSPVIKRTAAAVTATAATAARKRTHGMSTTTTRSTTMTRSFSTSNAVTADDPNKASHFISRSTVNESAPTMRFTVHSIFRHSSNHNAKMLPHGLEWDLGGDSLVAYVPLLSLGSGNSGNCSVHTLMEFYNKYCSDSLFDTPTIRRAIVEAHNRWCFAKDLPFKSVHDIQSLTVPNLDVDDVNKKDLHYYVEWKSVDPSLQYSQTPSLSVQSHDDTITTDGSATGEILPSEVWLNGYYIGMLSPTTIDDILSKIHSCPSLRLAVKKSYTTTLTSEDDDNHNVREDDDSFFRMIDCNADRPGSSLEQNQDQTDDDHEEKKDAVVAMEACPTEESNANGNRKERTRVIRVERKFRGGIRGYDVFDHMLDNLYALEDVEVLSDDDKATTYIGTATVADWIMGGDLTSRLWVQKDKIRGDIQFYRPLYNDDISTTDRRYRLVKNTGNEEADQSDDSSYDDLYHKTFPKDTSDDDAKIDIVDCELDRIRYLAGLPIPFPKLKSVDPVPKAAMSSRELQHRRNRRRFFGM